MSDWLFPGIVLITTIFTASYFLVGRVSVVTAILGAALGLMWAVLLRRAATNSQNA